MKPTVALLVILFAIAAIIGVFVALSAYPQDPCYHRFADKRAFLGIPNFWNVVSNLPFLIFGVLCWKRSKGFALGLILTTFGSGFYHWIPSNASLYADRFGIVIAAMALVSLLIEEYAGGYARISLVIAEVIGVGSLLLWYALGDLRLYGVVQVFPALLIVALPLVSRPRNTGHALLALVLIFYAIAKLCEMYDAEIYGRTYIVSGHTLKHVVAAAAAAAVWLWLTHRRPIVEAPPEPKAAPPAPEPAAASA